MAQTWLVRATGHSRKPLEDSLAVELRRVYEMGREAERKQVTATCAPRSRPE
jgi:hypothetical protein